MAARTRSLSSPSRSSGTSAFCCPSLTQVCSTDTNALQADFESRLNSKSATAFDNQGDALLAARRQLKKFYETAKIIGQELAGVVEAGAETNGSEAPVTCEYCRAPVAEAAYAAHVKQHLSAPVTKHSSGVVVL